MALTESQIAQLHQFFNQSDFPEKGAVITDLDGTAIHEFEGKYSIPQSVELGLEHIYALGRPVVINTLRFPLSVIRTFGKEWYKISNNPIPTVLLNGSLLGYIIQVEEGSYAYEELEAFPLKHEEIDDVIRIVKGFIDKNEDQLLVFYYPRDWRKGEIIWTPVEDRVDEVHKKYRSASSVYSGKLEKLTRELKSEDICMIFLLIEIPQDKLMAYQHTKKSNFFTTKGVDKQSGSEHIATLLGFDIKHSLGAGDSEMDTFLMSVGQAVHVSNPYLKYQGVLPPIQLPGSAALGDLLFELAALQKNLIPDDKRS